MRDMHDPSDRRATRTILAGLIFVALLGTIMRYKIGFELPLFHQKYLQESHSHFAFAGWLTQILMFLMARIFRQSADGFKARPYRLVLAANLIMAYGMLVSFLWQGYGPVSIFFATGSIVTFFLFAGYAFRDIRRLPDDHPARPWWNAALLLGMLSTIGTFVLTRMLVLKDFDQHTYLGSIYFYLHFQYNGWFFFACTGLLMTMAVPAFPDAATRRTIFRLFFAASLPAYFLSTLWANLPTWLYTLVIIAALMQAVAMLMLANGLWRRRASWLPSVNGQARWLFMVAGAALVIKLGLQLGSTVPEISKLAFGFRHIVIAYLHLVLLLILTVFLLGYLRRENLLPDMPVTRTGLVLFVGGAIFNELILTVQGVASLSYTVIPLANEILLAASAIMLAGAVSLVAGCRASTA